MQRPSKSRRCPRLQTPAQWTAQALAPAALSTTGSRAFRDEQLAAAVTEAIAHNADLRVGAARVEQAQLHAKLAGAKLYPSVDAPRARRRQAVRRRLGPPGHRHLRDLGARPLGPGALRPGGERRASRVDGGGFRLRAAVDRRARGQELVPRHRSRVADRGGTRDHSCERGARAAGRRPVCASGSAIKRMCSWRAPASGPIATSCVSSSWDASRRFGRSSSCSAGTPRPQRPRRRSCQVYPARSRGDCHRRFWSGGRT